MFEIIFNTADLVYLPRSYCHCRYRYHCHRCYRKIPNPGEWLQGLYDLLYDKQARNDLIFYILYKTYHVPDTVNYYRISYIYILLVLSMCCVEVSAVYRIIVQGVAVSSVLLCLVPLFWSSLYSISFRNFSLVCLCIDDDRILPRFVLSACSFVSFQLNPHSVHLS